jgi:hypothetical protein
VEGTTLLRISFSLVSNLEVYADVNVLHEIKLRSKYKEFNESPSVIVTDCSCELLTVDVGICVRAQLIPRQMNNFIKLVKTLPGSNFPVQRAIYILKELFL